MPAVRLEREGAEKALERATNLLETVHPCGFLVFGGTSVMVRRFTEAVQREAAYPLIFAADVERGAGEQFRPLTVLPPPMALASVQEPEAAAAEAGRLTGSEALSAGINLLFAPVCDVNSNPRNPIINVRSFSDEGKTVSCLVRRWIESARATGAAVCAKHFPGHGSTGGDSHLEVVRATGGKRAAAAALGPFRAALEAGADCVMTAHIIVDAFDPDSPATLSRRIVTGILREKMGFDGVVVTDALGMAGTGMDEYAAALRAAEAGCDILLYPRDPKRLSRMLEENTVGGNESLRRIETLARHIAEATGYGFVRTLSLEMVIRVSGEVFRPEEVRILNDDERVNLKPLLEALAEKGISTSVFRKENAGVGEATREGGGEKTVSVLTGFPGAWRGRLGPAEELLKEVAPEGGLVAFGDPWILERFPKAAFRLSVPTLAPPVQRAVAAVLVGDAEPKGRLPVKLKRNGEGED